MPNAVKKFPANLHNRNARFDWLLKRTVKDTPTNQFFLTLSSSVSPTKFTHNLPIEQEKINEVINSLQRNMESVDLDAITRSNSIDAPYDELTNDTLSTGYKTFTENCQNIAASSTRDSNNRLISFEAVNRIDSQIFPEVNSSINTEVAENSLEFRNNQGHLSGILDVKIKSFGNFPETSDQSCSNFNELRNLNPESSEMKELKRLVEKESMEESTKSETGSAYTSLRDEIGEKTRSYRDLRSIQRDISLIHLDHAREKRQENKKILNFDKINSREKRKANKKILNFDKNNSNIDMRDESSFFDFFIMYCNDYYLSHNVDLESFERIYNEIFLGNIFYDPREIRIPPEHKSTFVNKKVSKKPYNKIIQQKPPLETKASMIESRKVIFHETPVRTDDSITSSAKRLNRIRSKRRSNT